MQQPKSLLSIFVLMVTLAFVSACDSSDPDSGNSPGTDSFEGYYDFVEMTDKTGEILETAGATVTAGETNTISIQQGSQTFSATVLLNGNILFTDSGGYTFTFSVQITSDAFGTRTQNSTETGSYAVSGITMTITPDFPEAGATSEQLTISSNGDRLVLDDAELRLVLEKR